jgi:hypothetical protein
LVEGRTFLQTTKQETWHAASKCPTLHSEQELLDEGYLISTSFLKDPEGRGAPGDWAVRVTFERNKDYIDPRGEQSLFNEGTFFFYVMDESEGARRCSLYCSQ